jgi:hypothetical protein
LPSPPPDSRFLALRFAAQDATDFHLDDDAVRRFIELHDAGAGEDEIAAELGVEPVVVRALVRADAAQVVAHRIAAGDEPMYPAPEPADRVVDTRAGSSWVPFAAIVVALVGVIVWALAR